MTYELKAHSTAVLPKAIPHIELDVLTVYLKGVFDDQFFISRGLHRHGLPELMMCNLKVNEDSSAVFGNVMRVFLKNLKDPSPIGFNAVKTLTSLEWSPFGFQGRVIGADQQERPVQMSGAIRKLKPQEQYLTIAQLYESAAHGKLNVLTIKEIERIAKVGLAVVEIADEHDHLPNQSEYDSRRLSKLNQITLH